jgi:hypothetical protein
MTARNRLLVPVALGALSLLVGCASAPPQANNPPPRPAQMVEGSGTDSQRTTIQSNDNQIYGAEHAMDPDAATASGTQNQGIP